MYEKGEEPMVVGMYRKELAGELCCYRLALDKTGRREDTASLLHPRVSGGQQRLYVTNTMCMRACITPDL